MWPMGLKFLLPYARAYTPILLGWRHLSHFSFLVGSGSGAGAGWWRGGEEDGDRCITVLGREDKRWYYIIRNPLLSLE